MSELQSGDVGHSVTILLQIHSGICLPKLIKKNVVWSDKVVEKVKIHTHTYTHSALTAIFRGEPGLAGCPLNSPSPFIPGLCILFGQA